LRGGNIILKYYKVADVGFSVMQHQLSVICFRLYLHGRIREKNPSAAQGTGYHKCWECFSIPGFFLLLQGFMKHIRYVAT